MANDTIRNESTPIKVLVVATIILGVIVGASSLALGLFLDAVEEVFLHFQETNTLPVSVDVSGKRRLLSVFAGGTITAIAWYFLQKHRQPTSVTKAVDGKPMTWWSTIIHDVIQIFYVGCGGCIGRELAPREMGAMLAQQVDSFFEKRGFAITEEDKRLLVAAGAGAGFAGVYISPLTGMLFCIEVLYKKATAKAVAVSLTMSCIATLIGSITKGFVPYYLVPSSFQTNLLPLAIAIGPLFGVIGYYVKRINDRCSSARPMGKKIFILLPAVALATGCIAYFYPHIMGNGRGTAQLAFDMNDPATSALGLLVFGAVSKLGMTALTLRAGGYGGTLSPSIGAGASLGLICGFAYSQIVPGADLTQCALIGSVALLTATQKAPLMALFMLFEICHLDYSALLPLGITAALSIAAYTAVDRLTQR